MMALKILHNLVGIKKPTSTTVEAIMLIAGLNHSLIYQLDGCKGN